MYLSIFDPIVFQIWLNVLVDPVECTPAKLELFKIGSPTVPPPPGKKLITPSGKSRNSIIFEKYQDVSGASSGAFKITELPHINAGNTFHAIFAIP